MILPPSLVASGNSIVLFQVFSKGLIQSSTSIEVLSDIAWIICYFGISITQNLGQFH